MGPSVVEPSHFARYLAEPQELDTVVTEMREIDRRAGMDRTLAIGRLVLHRFFGGSVQAWQERRKNKNNSVRRLAQHPMCPLSRSALNQAIGIFVAVQALACDQTFGHIGPSHVAAVLHLRPHSQKHWLQRAERERWGVRELKANVTQQRRATGERRGRPPLEQRGRAESNVCRMMRSLSVALDELLEANLEPDDLQALAALAVRLAALERDLLATLRQPIRSDPCVRSAGSSGPTPLKEVG
jgi:hypothetical protein